MSRKHYPADDRKRNHHGPNDANTHNSSRPDPKPRTTVIVNDFPPLCLCGHLKQCACAAPEGTMLGEYSYFIPSENKRLIPVAHLKRFEDESDTEVGFARKWRKELGKRQGRKDWHNIYARSSRPFWYHPSHIPDAIYVDIKAAYVSIYERLSWHVEYERKKFMSIDHDTLLWPYPMTWKVGRSFIVTGSQALTPQRFVMNRTIHQRNVFNPYLNLPFHAAVMDVLSAIARFVIPAYECIYYNCDGAIIPSKYESDYSSFCSTLDITTKVKARGSGHVTDAGYWRVGYVATKPYRMSQGNNYHGLGFADQISLDMTLDEATWILRKFEKLPESKRWHVSPKDELALKAHNAVYSF